jgi:hypothetical protein
LSTEDFHVQGGYEQLAGQYEVDTVLFMGFLDGVQDSLSQPFDIEGLEPDSELDFTVEPEKLYFNMLAAGAEHLYKLPVWDGVLDSEKRAEIEKAYKVSRTVRKEKAPGRNDPCPCGSGKKYKKCCGI